MRIVRAWIYGYFGHENIGDEAILCAIKMGLEQLGQQPLVFTNNVANSCRTMPAKYFLTPPLDMQDVRPYGRYYLSYWVRNGLRLMPYLVGNKACIYACGGSINDHVPGRVEGLLRRVEGLRRLGFKVAILGAGVDQIVSAGDREAARVLINDRLSYCSVRDPESGQILLDLGASSARFEVTTDPVYGMDMPKASERMRGELKEACFVLNLRPLFQQPLERGDNKRQRYADYLKDCQMLLTRLSELVKQIELVPFSPEDEQFMAGLELSGNAELLPFDPNLQTAMNRVASANLLLGMRLHSVVFGMISGLPVVPLVYAPKVKSIASAIGLDADSLSVGDGTLIGDQPLQVDAIIRSLEDVWANADTFTKRSQLFVNKHRQIAERDLLTCWKALSHD